MATWEFKLPDIGEGVTEGEIVAWHIKAGDAVIEDQPMVEVMTDKATVMITSPRAGTITKTVGKVGDIVQVHEIMVEFDLGGGSVATPAPSAPKTPAPTAKNDDGPAATAVGDIKESLPGTSAVTTRMATRIASAEASASMGGAGGGLASLPSDKPLATPATRLFARERGVDLRFVPPTGPNGRVTKRDVESFSSSGGPVAGGSNGTNGDAHVNGNGANGVAEARLASSGATNTGVAAFAPTHLPKTEREERVPFAGMRRKISQRMSQSKNTAAHFTFVEECDATALKELRARLRPEAEKMGVKLSFLPFFVKACVAALKKHPILNSALDETTNELVYRKYYNIGIAAATDAGLVVPVVKDADRRSLLEVAREIERLAADTKSGKAKVDDLSGSTFTITSLGQQGGLFATPIINFPEVAILGIHQIKEKPVVRNGQIVIGEVMLLSLSFDHRIVDGHIGASFAYDIINYLQNPDRLFLEMS